jgi:hypothetical protein
MLLTEEKKSRVAGLNAYQRLSAREGAGGIQWLEKDWSVPALNCIQRPKFAFSGVIAIPHMVQTHQETSSDLTFLTNEEGKTLRDRFGVPFWIYAN